MTEKKTQVDVTGQTPETLGARLQARRQELGWSLEDIEARLKIRRATLQAIEGERYSELPDKVYALGFIKSYARFLGLNVDEIMQQARGELASVVPKRQTVKLDLPGPQTERSAGLWILLAVGLIVIAGGYVGWYHFYAHGRLGASIFPSHMADKMVDGADDVPHSATTPGAPAAESQHSGQTADQSFPVQGSDSHQAEPAVPTQEQGSPVKPEDAQKETPDLPPPPSEAVSPATDDNNGASSEHDQAQQPEQQNSAGDSLPSPSQSPSSTAPQEGSKQVSGPSVSTQPQASPSAAITSAGQGNSNEVAAPAQALAPTPAKTPEVPAQAVEAKQGSGDILQIHALEDSWVHVVDASGKSLISQLLKKGDVWQGERGAAYHVTCGNAGGVVLQAGNVVSAPLGLRGKVVHAVLVNAELVEQGRYGHGSLSAGTVALPGMHR